MSRITCLFMLATLVLAGGCGDDDGGNNLNEHQNPPGWEVQDVVVADDLKVIDDAVDIAVEPTTLVISAQVALVSDIQPGDLVVSSKGSGFLRRVVSVVENQDGVVFQTETASLAEAIQQGKINGPIPLEFSHNPSQKDGLGLDYSGQIIYNSDGLTITLSQATINFSPDLNLEIDYNSFSLEYFKAEAIGNLTGTLAVQAVYDGSTSFSDIVSLYDSAPIITTIWAGPVPIVIVTTLHLEAGFVASFEGSLSAEAGASFTAQVSAGAEFSNGAWDVIAEQDFQLTAIGPTLEVSANADLRVFLRPKIVTKLYGVAGPTIAIEPYGHLSVDLLPSPGWELSAGVLGTIDVEIEAFDHVLASYSDTLFDFEWPLAEWSFVPTCPLDMMLINDNFCIDIWEASRPDATSMNPGVDDSFAVSAPDRHPWWSSVLSAAEADLACQNANKRLCLADEWQTACSGSQQTVYGYGDVYQPETCNGIDTFCDCTHPTCAAQPVCPYDSCWSQCGGSFSVSPTGSFPNCVNDFGLYDMNGNVYEVVDSTDIYPFRGGGFNCANSMNNHRCDFVPTFNISAKGFRCCADPF